MKNIEIGTLVHIPGWSSPAFYMGLRFYRLSVCSMFRFRDGSTVELDCSEWTSFEAVK